MSAQTAPSPATVIMAQTLWGEARGCGAAGMRHVASVIMNRVRHPRWWGSDAVSVCLAPEQFSCWLAGDPNLPKLKAVTTADPEFRLALAIAQAATAGTLADGTGGADSYYALSMAHPPAWAKRAAKTSVDGWHQFCRVDLPAPSGQPEAPAVSVHAPVPAAPSAPDPDHSADALMAAEIEGEQP